MGKLSCCAARWYLRPKGEGRGACPAGLAATSPSIQPQCRKNRSNMIKYDQARNAAGSSIGSLRGDTQMANLRCAGDTQMANLTKLFHIACRTQLWKDDAAMHADQSARTYCCYTAGTQPPQLQCSRKSTQPGSCKCKCFHASNMQHTVEPNKLKGPHAAQVSPEPEHTCLAKYTRTPLLANLCTARMCSSRKPPAHKPARSYGAYIMLHSHSSAV
jgi:hypothetical protein